MLKLPRDLIVHDKTGQKFLLPRANYGGALEVTNLKVRLKGIDFVLDGREFADVDSKGIEIYPLQTSFLG